MEYNSYNNILSYIATNKLFKNIFIREVPLRIIHTPNTKWKTKDERKEPRLQVSKPQTVPREYIIDITGN